MLKQVHLPGSSPLCARAPLASVDPSGLPRSITPLEAPPPLLPPLPPPLLLPLSKLDGLLFPVAAQAAIGSPTARIAPIARRGERPGRVDACFMRRMPDILASGVSAG